MTWRQKKLKKKLKYEDKFDLYYQLHNKFKKKTEFGVLWFLGFKKPYKPSFLDQFFSPGVQS